MTNAKVAFIKNDLVELLNNVSPDTMGKWGKMNAQQMVEHLTDFFDASAGKMHQEIITPEEHLPKYKEFLLSEKPFRENTKAPVNLVPEEPVACKQKDMATAISLLRNSINNFFLFFENNPSQTTIHPVFGQLNYEEWIQLHYKHVMHHLRQFGKVE